MRCFPDGFVWVHSAIILLLDLIKNSLNVETSSSTLQEKWKVNILLLLYLENYRDFY